MELATTTAKPALLEIEDRTSLERIVLLLLLRVGIVASVKSSSQFRVTEHLIRFVDRRHLLLCLLLGDTKFGCLVGMVLLRDAAVRGLDLAVVGITLDAQDLVIVLGFTSL